MTFDVEDFMNEIRRQRSRFRSVGTSSAHPGDEDLVYHLPEEEGDFEPATPLGRVAINPDEYKAIAEYVRTQYASYSIRDLNPRKHHNIISLYGIEIQIIDRKSLFLRHLSQEE